MVLSAGRSVSSLYGLRPPAVQSTTPTSCRQFVTSAYPTEQISVLWPGAPFVRVHNWLPWMWWRLQEDCMDSSGLHLFAETEVQEFNHPFSGPCCVTVFCTVVDLCPSLVTTHLSNLLPQNEALFSSSPFALLELLQFTLQANQPFLFEIHPKSCHNKNITTCLSSDRSVR